MARINFEDKVESEPEFGLLLDLIKDRRMCLGMLVDFFRLCQRHYVKEEAVSTRLLELHGLTAMLRSGWAVEFKDGWMTIGAERQFGWLISQRKNSRKGGDALIKIHKANKIIGDREAHGRPTGIPLTLTPTLTLNTNTNTSNESRSSEVVISEFTALEGKLRNVSAKVQSKWLDLYGQSFVLKEIQRADIWIAANAHRAPKTNFARFFSNWLSNGWDRERKTMPAKVAKQLDSEYMIERLKKKAEELA